jgi:PAS domain S-box-containing protein
VRLFTRVVLIIGVALLPVLAMQMFNAAELRDARRADVREEALREAQAVATELRWITAGVRSALIAVAANPEIRSADPGACAQTLQTLRASLPALRAISLLDENDALVCSSAESPDSRAAADAPELRLSRARGSVALGGFVRDTPSGAGKLPVAYPVRGLPGAGPVLVADIDLGWLAGQLARRRLAPDSLLWVADRNGVVLANLPGPSLAGQPLPPPNRAVLDAAGPSVVERRGADGLLREVGFVPPGAAMPDVFTAVGLSTERAFAATDAAAARGYALIAASFLAALVLALFTARSIIARPVRAILDTTERWRQGDTAARVPGGSGRSEFARIAGSVNDMLEAVAAGQDRLRERLAELRAIYDASPVGLGFLDRSLRYVTINARLAEINNRTEAEHRGRKAREILPPAAGDRVEPLHRRALEGEAIAPHEVEAATEAAPGVPRRLLVSYQPAKAPDGTVFGVVIAIQDVTALRRTEAALAAALQAANAELERRVAERTAQLEVEVREREAAQSQLLQAQKMEVIGQLTGGIAHDFNNLLAAIIGNLELAAARSRDRPDVARLLEGALRSADRGASLTQQMLAFGRRQFLRPRPIALAALLDGMGELLGRTIGPSVRVQVEIPPSLPLARADPHQTELLVLNLVVNARDAMPAGGTVSITAVAEEVVPGHEHPAGLTPGHYVRLSVADTGEGMDAATQARAFEPFYTTKPVGRGSGLGLPMVQGVAAQSGGGVAISSAPGHGTTVSVWLPRAEDAKEPAPPPPPAAPMPAAAGQELLVVEDEAEVAAFAAACLEEAGYRVRRAADGEAALRLLQTGPPPNLMIADLGMPGMSGLQLAAAARRLHPGLPILIATGYAADDAVGDAAPELPVLTKPFKAADLLARVAALLVPAPAAADPA